MTSYGSSLHSSLRICKVKSCHKPAYNGRRTYTKGKAAQHRREYHEPYVKGVSFWRP